MDAKDHNIACFSLGYVCGLAGRAEDAGALTVSERRQLHDLSWKLYRWVQTLSIEDDPPGETPE